MDRDKAIVIFEMTRRKQRVDLEIPLYITAKELVYALNAAYDLKIDVSDAKNCYLKSERPIALLRGNKTLAEYGIQNGSIIYF
ncbi:MAG: EsaB/YukD family protein [Lachnospiraceae bacterium]|nr:EsaB/YukD family protein [Lachnospiraceae bacterium]